VTDFFTDCELLTHWWFWQKH